MLKQITTIGRYATFAGQAWRKRALIRSALDALGERSPPAVAARNIHVPLLPIAGVSERPGYMMYSSCAASDFLDPRFHEVCAQLQQVPRFHRKQWEFVYICHHLERLGMLAAGRRGIGFGVGQEPLPALFAAQGAGILATDAPLDIGIAAACDLQRGGISGAGGVPQRGYDGDSGRYRRL